MEMVRATVDEQQYVLRIKEGKLVTSSDEEQKAMFELEQKKKRRFLENVGIVFCEDGCTVKLAKSNINGENLTLCMRCLKNDGNQLKYVLFESNGDREYGVERKEQMVSDKQIEEQKITIDNIVKSFTGLYTECLSSIKVNISIIHNYRLLKGIRSINSERLPINDIVNGLKGWLLEHIHDSRVGVTEIQGETRIVLLCPIDYKKGIKVGKIFKEIFYEIAPENNFSAFKAELYRRNMLICDRNDDCIDIQKTISRAKCLELGTNSVKIICFKFEAEFVNAFLKTRNVDEQLKEINEVDFDMMFAEGDMLSKIYDAGMEG